MPFTFLTKEEIRTLRRLIVDDSLRRSGIKTPDEYVSETFTNQLLQKLASAAKEAQESVH
jgi:hypothetical protein